MQSNAFHLSSSTPLLQRRRRTTTTNNNKPLLDRNPNPSFSSSSSSSSFKPVVLKSFFINGVSVTRSSSLLYSSCFNKNSKNSHHSTIVSSYGGGNEQLISVEEEQQEKEATAVPESIVVESSSSSSSESKKFSKTLELAVLIAFWYMSNIYFNIFNKQVLKVYPYPMTLSAFQLSAGTVLSLIMWTFNLHKRPTKITTSQLLAILPLAIVHTMGNLFTNMSLGKVSVSFTHTIKAMEPFFSVLLSAMFLGEKPSLWVVSSLIPVVGGVALASLTEASFNWIGFWSAMASNLTNQSRNVFSKKIMGKKEEALDNITLFSIMTIMSFILMVPVALLIDGVKFSPSYLQASGLDVRELCVRCLLLGFFFHTYQQLSYMILERLSPVTHSVSNSVKRVVVIVSSVLFFRTPVSPINAIGTGIALAGVFLYSRVKQIKPKEKPKTV